MRLTKIIAGILIALALALALLAWQLMRQPERQVAPAPVIIADNSAASSATPPVPAQVLFDVVMLARDVPAGYKLSAEDLKVVQLPAKLANSFSKTHEALGHTTILAMSSDAPLLEQNLVSGLALQLEPGERAVAIAVNEGMAAGHRVRPGDFVDVFVTLDAESNDHSPVDTQNRLMLARSRVLAYGGASVDNPPPTPAQQQRAEQEQQNSQDGSRRSGSQASRDEQNMRPENAKTAVLAVPLGDVQRLGLAEKYGQLTLALRHPDDLAVPDASLFTALPAVLRPKAGSLAKDQQLEGADRAFAGMRLRDLASGGDDTNRKRAAAPPLPAPVPRSQRGPQQHPVQVHNGASVQTVHY